MEIFFILIVLIATVLVVAVIFSGRLPSSWVLEKAVLVKASPARIYPLLDTLENWTKWTVWNNVNEPTLQFSYEGSRIGVGSTQVWKSQKLNGRLTITKSQLDRELQYRFELAEGSLVIVGTFALAMADPEYTQVAWRCQLEDVQSINPLQRYMAYFLRTSFDSDMEESLNNLVEIFEQDSNFSI